MIDETESADEDVVAKLQALRGLAGRLRHGELHIVAQAQLFGFELEEAPAERVVLEVRRAVEQLVLAPLHIGRAQQGHRQRDADQAQPEAANPVTRIVLATVMERIGAQCSSSALSCQAARL